MRFFQLLPLFFALLLTVSVPSVASAPAKPGVRVPDAEIADEIKTRLSKSKIGKNGFQFKVANGVVTWTGKTDVIQHKGAATRMAKSSGARSVVNNIQISEAAKAKARARFEGREGDTKPQKATVVR